MIKEIPILFGTPMVKAIIEDQKTQTRRIIKCRTQEMIALMVNLNAGADIDRCREEMLLFCPYGQPGDLLWVRESWRPIGWDFEDGDTTIQYKDGTTQTVWLFGDDSDKERDYHMKLCDLMEKKCDIHVDEENERFYWTKEEMDKHMPWKPSIHMRKEAARIWLEVKSRRVERVRDISDKDAKQEGVETLDLYPGYDVSSRGKFEGLWGSINGIESWEENDWVWVIEFKRIEKSR